MQSTHIANLIHRHLNGTITAADAAELQLWAKASPENERLLADLTDETGLMELVLFNEQYEQRNMKASLYEKISSQLTFSHVQRVHYLRKWRWAVAAAMLIILATGAYFWRANSGKEDHTIAYAQEIHPGSNSAFITLADGSHVLLDSIQNSVVPLQGSTQLIKDSTGSIAYKPVGEKASQVVAYNRLHNPRGSRVAKVVLPDGSKVWMNAGSILTYPTAFNGNTREVSLLGEAYFEVAHQASMPFIVNSQRLHVTVLGTHFNVSAYEEDKDKKVTLLEGSVRVDKEGLSGILQPGQQAVVTDGIQINKNADTEQAIAWKEGLFQFNKSSIDAVLREAARWYDIEIVYEGKQPNDTFTGGISRSSSLAELLTILQMNRVHFRLEGRKLIVLNGPQNK